ncbi:hypothetical protein F5Y15DRAFT_148214 [Xylariaceae sp. FL0016]|nr:hypothetical protein F5Y15DRAFT_148214 [Xylariaceae sp. FL0016]
MSPPVDASSSACAFQPGKDFEGTFSPCFYEACTPLEALDALNITSVICGVPTRDISVAIRVYVIVATALASVVISLRVYAKFRGLAGSIDVDDWFIVLAVTVTLIASVGQYLGAHYGLGRDAWKVSKDDQISVYKSFFVAAIGYKLGNACCRMSILLFYLRLFSITDFRMAVIICVVFSGCIGVAFALADSLHCDPASYFWNGWIGTHKGFCGSLPAITWVHSILNIFLDLVTLGMAFWIVYSLNIRWIRKFEAIAMFVLGSAVTIVSFLRIMSIPPLYNERNRTWSLAPVSYWSGIEMFFGMVCACLPALKALVPARFRSRSTQASSERHTPPRDSRPRITRRTPEPRSVLESKHSQPSSSTTGTAKDDGASVIELMAREDTGRTEETSDSWHV